MPDTGRKVKNVKTKNRKSSFIQLLQFLKKQLFCIMFKLLFLFIFILFNSFEIWGQKLTLSPSPVDEAGFEYLKVIGQDQDGYFILLSNLSLETRRDRIGFKNRKFRLAYFNINLTPKWIKPLTAEPEDANIDAVTFINGNVLIVSSMENKNGISLYARWADNSGNITGSKNPVAELSLSGEYEKARMVTSANKKRIALVVHEYNNDEKQTEHVTLFDYSLQLTAVKRIHIPFGEKKFSSTGYALSDNGDFVMLGMQSEKVKSFSSKRKYDYFVFSSAVNDSGFVQQSVTGEKQITGLGVEFDNVNRKAVLAGFYSEKQSYTGAGVFYASLDVTGGTGIKINTSSIDPQKNIKLTGERNSRSGLSIIGYPIERIVLRNDGGAVIVAEASYTSEYSYYDYFTQSFTQHTEYHFDNIVIISVNSDGSIDWSNIVEKDQTSIDDGGIFSSFCSLLNSEELIVVYNNDISRQNEIITASIGNKGEMKENKPVASGERLMLLPRSGKQVSENEILVPAYRKKDLLLVRISFE
jgi:hypothetical protein